MLLNIKVGHLAMGIELVAEYRITVWWSWCLCSVTNSNIIILVPMCETKFMDFRIVDSSHKITDRLRGMEVRQ